MKIYTSQEVQNAKNKTYPTEIGIRNLNDFKKAVTVDHVMCQFSGNERSKVNFIECDCIYGDIDNTHSEEPSDWITVKQFSELFKGVEYYLATSTSHQKEKNGKKERDKYHVYFPVKTITDGVKLEYWLKVLTTKYDFFDPAVKDSARFFFGNPSTLVNYNPGKSILTLLHGFKVEKENADPIPLNFDTGNRNDTMFRWACSLHGNGVSDEEMEVFLSQLNEGLSDQLSEREISTIIKSTHRYDQIIPKTLNDDNFIRNYTYIGTGEMDNDGNEKMKCIMLNDPEDFDTACEYYISFQDQSGKLFLFDKEHLDFIVVKKDEFTVKLMLHNTYLDFKPRGVTPNEYMEWVKNSCQRIERVSRINEIKKNKKTVYFKSDITPNQSGMFRKMIDSMTFATIQDKYRMASGLLSGFLGSSYDGRKPLFAVMADSQSSGKTSAVRVSVKCVQGDSPIEFRGDEKDEAQIGGIKQLANKFVLYDNLQKISNKQLLNITTQVTDGYIPSWFFGVSHARVKNNKTYFATFNSEESINTDVLNRIVSIRMKDGRDITDKELIKITDDIAYYSSHKDEVLSDIYYELDNIDWDKEIPYKRHVKFADWSKNISKMLKPFFPDVDEFDFSLSVSDKELSSESVMFEEFMDELLEGKNYVFIFNSELIDKYREFYRNPRATKTSCTRHINNMKKSFSSKYGIDVGKVKNISKKSFRGIEIKKLMNDGVDEQDMSNDESIVKLDPERDERALQSFKRYLEKKK